MIAGRHARRHPTAPRHRPLARHRGGTTGGGRECGRRHVARAPNRGDQRVRSARWAYPTARIRSDPTRSRRAGETRAEVEQLIRETIPFHLEGLAEDGLPIPDPASVEAEAVAV